MSTLTLKMEEKQPQAEHILILGGGIGGLASALALTKKGYRVSVFEKFANQFIVGNGAGLSLVQKVLEILKEIGCDEELIKNKINLASHMVLETYDGKPIRREDNTTKLSASWSNLYEILDGSLPSDFVHYTKRIVNIEKLSDGKIVLTDHNGCKHIGDALIVADGARSKVRELLTNTDTMKVLNYTGHMNLRGIIEITDSDEDKAFEERLRKAYPDIEDAIHIEFGDNFHTGMQMLPGKKISWWSYVNSEDPIIWPNLTAMGQWLKPELTALLYSKMQGQVSERLQMVFDHTKVNMVNVITDADIDKWVYHDNIVLIGDAAHPMTPNCGLAACMAVVDGYTLASHVAKFGTDFAKAFASYEKARLEPVRKFVQLDHDAGQQRNNFAAYKDKVEEFDNFYIEAHQLFASPENIAIVD